MTQVNAMGDQCPIPVIKTKKAIQALGGAGEVETLVDNEIAVQNLTKMANQKGFPVVSEKLGANEYRVVITVPEGAAFDAEEAVECAPDMRTKNTVVVISSSTMGIGDDVLGGILIKGFIFAISQRDTLPETILFYNGGVKMTCEGSPALEDLKSMEAKGVKILSCGTCLNHYGLTEKIQVGVIGNMYDIAEAMSTATLIIKP